MRYWASARSEDDIRDFSKAYLDLAEVKGKMKGLVIHEGTGRRRGRKDAKAEEEAKKEEEEAKKKAEEDAVE